MAAATNPTMWMSSTNIELIIFSGLSIDPMIDSLFSVTFISKNSFQSFMWVVNKNGFIALKTGMFKVLKIVKKIITLIVATIGPIEFSAKTDSKKPSAATVNMATAAKPNAPI